MRKDALKGIPMSSSAPCPRSTMNIFCTGLLTFLCRFCPNSSNKKDDILYRSINQNDILP